MLRAFFSYYGGKSKIAQLYPPPKHKIIVEPFAGAAGYASRHHHHDVVLIEKNPKVFALWDWLINHATKKDIMDLPPKVHDVREEDIPLGAKYLIGFWLMPAAAAPGNKPTKWAGSDPLDPNRGWGIVPRNRLANQVQHIKHWRVLQGDFSRASSIISVPATWYVDPPYQMSGSHYPESSKQIDFSALGDWCQSLLGQVIVCEQGGADWLPFRGLHNFDRGGQRGPSRASEVVWLSEGNYRRRPAGFEIGEEEC